MTYQEIYNLICYKCWGDLGASPPPAAIANYLPQMIFRAHRKIQQDYNYWFMRFSITQNTIAAQEAYALPDAYKEMIEIRQQLQGDTKYLPSIPVVHFDELKYLNSARQQALYAKCYALMNNNMYLHPIPQESDIVINLHLWKFLVMTIDATFEDDLMRYGGSAIVNYVVSELKQDLDESNASARYFERFTDDMEQLQREDYRRRQSMLEDLEYNGV